MSECERCQQWIARSVAAGLAFTSARQHLSSDQIVDLQTELLATVESARDRSTDVAPGAVDSHDAFVNHLERLGRSLSYESEIFVGDEAEDIEVAWICMRCNVFPLATGEVCPECETSDQIWPLRA